MIDITHEHLTIVQQILQQYVPGVPVWIFGSRIKGTAKSYSDLDLVIIDRQKMPLGIFYKIKDAFEESTLPYRVDVLDWHRISPDFRKVIQQDYMRLDDYTSNH